MREALTRRVIWSVAALACGFGLLGSTGCDKQLQTTIQDGVITASGSLLGAIIQSAMAVALQQANGG
jgi:hypothetical protein